jgi:TolB-like protein/DNA-binding winged helix-turn-helix (wHTH) protein/Flp pilus assembly protein TadD
MKTTPGRNHAETYRFLDFALDTERQLLLRGIEQTRLRPRTYDVLAYLVLHSGRLVPKQELIDAVWHDAAVTDDSLVQSLMEIRRALGNAQDVVKTVRGRGYLFDTPVEVAAAPPNATTPAAPQAVTRLGRALIAAALAVAAGAVAVWLAYGGRLQGISGSPTRPIRSLAVLPLENLSRDPEQDYFADGMTDELIAQLAHIHSLRVVSRTSVMRFKGTQKPLAEIARELNVDAVVEGTVLRTPERVRVIAQVIQVNPEKHLWADRYDRPLGDVVVLQGQLAREISDAIRVTLTPEERTRFADVRPVDQEAYEAFLKGRYYWSKRTEQSTRKAIEYFQRAVEEEPQYALAFAGLADSYNSLALTEALQDVVPPAENLLKARAAADRALAIDDKLAEAHATIGGIKFQYERDWSASAAEFTRAIELNPNYANAHQWYGLSLIWMDRMDEALREFKRANELDPLSLVINANLCFALGVAGAYEQAVAHCRRTIELDPNFAYAHHRLGQVYVLHGSYDPAIEELQQAISLSGRSPRAIAELGLAYALSGQQARARGVLGELKTLSAQRYVSPFNLAVVYGGIGDRNNALRWLEKAYDEQSTSMCTIQVSPAFRTLHGEPRFQALVARTGLPPARRSQS